MLNEGHIRKLCTILCRVLGEVLTEKMIFEQRPEEMKRENHLGIWINTFLAEKTITKAS